ncbi:PREDICTED: probable 3-hydroxyisobutyryl-CoA hydrolase 3 isoform X2 [Tarenaya hassleriana]|uniref:probable 3-hydroxyisobutyryl-CoA hydrolase 3 isoform X2 n=1 Tax=Tarenaya hassleriana TaxID=28532 RepID=UPI00053C6693|nr:PREDICTED: probable 3-hydroxyisobutyryl-CoA hydrolase 3 isoform X2 [Tarenaya hassleriana]
MASQVLVEEKSVVRILTLNRPKQLNVLTSPMISRLLELFLSYQKNPNVKLIILKGQGRAFCAGGDVISCVNDIRRGCWRLATDFMYKQYVLDYVIATSPKPQVSIMDGIVMGGGAGISIHGRFRIATENTVFAMPEAALGHFADVGASYFLSRLPGFFGEYLGLAGARLDGAEMLASGLATHFVPSMRLKELTEDLCGSGASDAASISKIIDTYTQQPHLKDSSAYHRLDVIDKCFSRNTVEEIIFALEREIAHKTDDWVSRTILSMKKASPISLKITLRSIREGRALGIGQCLIREFRITSQVIKGDISKDLIEGCRAILIEKDNNPKWEPSRLEDVTERMVEKYFQRLEDDGWEDLKLPPIPNSHPPLISKL